MRGHGSEGSWAAAIAGLIIESSDAEMEDQAATVDALRARCKRLKVDETV